MNSRELITTARERFAEDRRKSGFLVVLMVTMALLMARQFLTKSLPEEATAQSIALDTQTKVEQSNQLAGVAQIVRLWRSKPIPQVQRDAFRSIGDSATPSIVIEVEPRPVSQDKRPGYTSVDGLFWRELSRTLQDVQRRKNRIATTESTVLTGAEQLVLKSVIAGATERVIVNDELLRVGETITTLSGMEFQLVKIEKASAVLEALSHRVEISVDGKPRLITAP